MEPAVASRATQLVGSTDPEILGVAPILIIVIIILVIVHVAIQTIKALERLDVGAVRPSSPSDLAPLIDILHINLSLNRAALKAAAHVARFTRLRAKKQASIGDTVLLELALLAHHNVIHAALEASAVEIMLNYCSRSVRHLRCHSVRPSCSLWTVRWRLASRAMGRGRGAGRMKSASSKGTGYRVHCFFFGLYRLFFCKFFDRNRLELFCLFDFVGYASKL